MDMIRNFHLVTEKIPDFKEKNLKWIISFNYHIDYNEQYDEVSFFEVEYVLESDGNKYKLCLKFKDVTSLKVAGIGGGFNQILGFKIDDMKERNWENKQRYFVHDYENDIMQFYCSSIEVLSISQL